MASLVGRIGASDYFKILRVTIRRLGPNSRRARPLSLVGGPSAPAVPTGASFGGPSHDGKVLDGSPSVERQGRRRLCPPGVVPRSCLPLWPRSSRRCAEVGTFLLDVATFVAEARCVGIAAACLCSASPPVEPTENSDYDRDDCREDGGREPHPWISHGDSYSDDAGCAGVRRSVMVTRHSGASWTGAQ